MVTRTQRLIKWTSPSDVNYVSKDKLYASYAIAYAASNQVVTCASLTIDLDIDMVEGLLRYNMRTESTDRQHYKTQHDLVYPQSKPCQIASIDLSCFIV